jgi:hypothetical protein
MDNHLFHFNLRLLRDYVKFLDNEIISDETDGFNGTLLLR